MSYLFALLPFQPVPAFPVHYSTCSGEASNEVLFLSTGHKRLSLFALSLFAPLSFANQKKNEQERKTTGISGLCDVSTYLSTAEIA